MIPTSVAKPEPRFFLAGAGADLKFDLEPEPIVWGHLRLLFLASEKVFSRFGTKSRFIEAFFIKI